VVPTPVGIDMAKDTFQAELVLPNARKCKEFTNTQSGFLEFTKWCHSFGATKLLVCMEATGRYGDALVTFMFALAHDVRVANGRRIRRFADALGLLNKTDKADAHAIAEYALHHGAQIPKWKPLSAARQELRDLRCLINGLQKTLNEYGNRQHLDIQSAVVREHIDQLIEFVEGQLETAKERASQVIDEDEQLKTDKAILMKQIGVKEAVSTVLLTRVDFRSFKSARQVARYLGLTPKREQSGTSIHRNGRISKEGPPKLRMHSWLFRIYFKEVARSSL